MPYSHCVFLAVIHVRWFAIQWYMMTRRWLVRCGSRFQPSSHLNLWDPDLRPVDFYFHDVIQSKNGSERVPTRRFGAIGPNDAKYSTEDKGAQKP